MDKSTQTPNPNASSLTRDQMEAEIASGRSILHNGAIITRVENLPSAARLANGDPLAEQIAAADLDRRISALEAERESLRRQSVPAKAISVSNDPAPTYIDVANLENDTLVELLGTAYHFEVPNIDTLESRTDVIAAIRAHVGYVAPKPVQVPSQVPSSPKYVAPPAPAAVVPTAPAPAAVVKAPSLQELLLSETLGAKTDPASEIKADKEQVPEITEEDELADPNAELAALDIDQLKAVAIESGVKDAAKMKTREELIAAIKASAGQ